MLSKNNKILIGCLALLLVMSVGYALFSDTITINGSATAKGDFELTTTCDMDAGIIDDAVGQVGGTRESGSVTDAKISCEGNVVNASATLGYPGSHKYFMIKVTNTGTIPAKLKKVVELSNPDEMIASKENGGALLGWIGKTEGTSTNSMEVIFLSDVNYMDDYDTEMYYGPEIQWTEELFDAVLDPGESTYFYIEMLWNSSSTTPGDPLTASLNAQLDWEQVTE